MRWLGEKEKTMRLLSTAYFRRTRNFAFAFAFAIMGAGVVGTAVQAATYNSYEQQSFSAYTWSSDRSAPSAGPISIVGNTLTMGVDNEHANTISTFYQTEGVQAEFGAPVRGIKAELFVDSDWATKPVRAGLWGVGHSETSPYTTWPIAEFTANNGEYTGWRIWNTMAGGWTSVDAPYLEDEWNSVEVSFNPATQNYEFYINDVMVHTYSAVDDEDVYDVFSGVIFNMYNYASTAENNYSVSWRNLSLGYPDTTAPIVTIESQSTTNTTPTITGTVDDEGAVVLVSIDGNEPVLAQNNGDGTWTLVLSDQLAVGVHAVQARAVDPAGNMGIISEGAIEITELVVVIPEVTTPVSAPVVSPVIASASQPAAATSTQTLTPVADTVTTTTDNPNDGGEGTTDPKSSEAAIPTWLWWLIGVLVVLGIAWWLFLVWRRRRNED